MNFLIVENNENMRRMLKVIVADLGGETFECADGSVALAAYAEHRPDWVLMDIKMEEVDGIRATRQITDSFPDAKVIVVSDYDDRDLHSAAREAGACGYVVKDNLHELSRFLQARIEEADN